jgi:hypothetical protein
MARKKVIGHVKIPVVIGALRAASNSRGESTFDFWWPLLDRTASTQFDNQFSQGYVHAHIPCATTVALFRRPFCLFMVFFVLVN